MNTNQLLYYIIVDDHPFFRSGVKHFLESFETYQLLAEFSESRSLLNNYVGESPHFILLDLNLPDIDGKKSAIKLRQKFVNSKIIAVTQYENLDTELFAIGFDGYVQKNDSDGLLEAIETVMMNKKYFRLQDDKLHTREKYKDDHLLFSIMGNISHREIQIIEFVCEGLTNSEIAAKLFLSEFTVKTHRKNFVRKSGLRKIPDFMKFMQNIMRHDKGL